jgi:hypothetical protein
MSNEILGGTVGSTVGCDASAVQLSDADDELKPAKHADGSDEAAIVQDKRYLCSLSSHWTTSSIRRCMPNIWSPGWSLCFDSIRANKLRFNMQ